MSSSSLSSDLYFETCFNQTIYPIHFCEVTSETTCKQMNQAIAVTPKVTGILSIFGTCLIIFRFFKMKATLRKTYDRLMLGMSFIMLFGTFAFFLGQFPYLTITSPNTTSPFCNFQGWLIQLGSAVFWYNGILCTNFLLRIRFRWTEEAVSQIELRLHLIAWFYPLVTSFVALGLGMYGTAGPWCWIYSPDWARFTFFFIPLWIIMIYTCICMFLIVSSVMKSDFQTASYRERSVGVLKKTSSHRFSQSSRKINFSRKTRQVAIQALLYVTAFLLTWIFATANRIDNWMLKSCSVFPLVWLQSFFVPLQGFLNFIVYIYPRSLNYRNENKSFKTRVKRCICCVEEVEDKSSGEPTSKFWFSKPSFPSEFEETGRIRSFASFQFDRKDEDQPGNVVQVNSPANIATTPSPAVQEENHNQPATTTIQLI